MAAGVRMSTKNSSPETRPAWISSGSGMNRLEDSDNLPAPGVIAAEIVEDLESALEQMRLIAEDLAEEAEDSVETRAG